jgi:hypothetical protein
MGSCDASSEKQRLHPRESGCRSLGIAASFWGLRPRPASLGGTTLRALLAAATLLSLVGCSADLGPSWVVIGQGDEHHAELADGDDVSIILGPQGGYMVPLSLRAGGILGGDPDDPTDPDNPRVTFQAFLQEDGEGADPLGSITVVRGLDAVDEAEFELLGTWLVFDAAVDTSVYFDQPLRVDARIADPLGNEATDSVVIDAVWLGDSTRSEADR